MSMRLKRRKREDALIVADSVGAFCERGGSDSGRAGEDGGEEGGLHVAWR